MRARLLFLVLLVFWGVLSWHPAPMLVGFGLATCAAVAWWMNRHDLLERDWTIPGFLKLAVLYMPWLLWQIAIANVKVLILIWHPKRPIQPSLVSIPSKLRTPTGRMIFANSITLTPGTVTVAMLEGEVIVHALTEEEAKSDVEGTDMQARLLALEPPPSGRLPGVSS
ncbi:Na+/H+ antiporter subunit E [Planctomycetota bacterium]|nr:Na+/H+ antiporter subunit E [Planctomycetota bacterium]